jgi:hypothetical protein
MTPSRVLNPSDGVVALGLFEPDDAPVLVEADRDPEHRRRFDFPDGFVASLAHSRAAIERWKEQRETGSSIPTTWHHVESPSTAAFARQASPMPGFSCLREAP